MTEKFAEPVGTIRRYAASRVCDVVVVVRGQEMVMAGLTHSLVLSPGHSRFEIWDNEQARPARRRTLIGIRSQRPSAPRSQAF